MTSDQVMPTPAACLQRRKLARFITQLDDGDDVGPLLDSLPANDSKAMVIAITGSAGIGKSTLIGALTKHLRTQGKKVAVLACDPASPRTGGALLGDRVRIDDQPADEGVFIRSISTRGAMGGLSAAAGPICRLLERFGFDVILVETIGVGQDQVAARDVADLVLLVLAPSTGDQIQWQKAGVMECAHVVAINKSDLPGAAGVASSVREFVGDVPVVQVIAESGQGVGELWQLLAKHVVTQSRNPTRQKHF